jgi:TetR/AcrR family transcriptional repressor of nem operon
MDTLPPTAERILDVAQRLAQSRGYNAFSYADLAEALGIRKASIHYHFPSKADLAHALVTRYRKEAAARLAQIDTETTDPVLKLRRYVALDQEMMADGNRVCLCGMFASDVLSLPDPVRAEVNDFFRDNERWLADVLREGQRQGSVRIAASADEEAQLFVAGLQGAMLIARSRHDPTHLRRVADRMLAALGLVE